MQKLPDVAIVERDARALELKKAHMSYRQIAQVLDVSVKTAHVAVQRALKRSIQQFSEDHQATAWLELERLDQMALHLYPLTMPHKATNDHGEEITLPPSMEAVDRILKIMDRRAKLLGLDNNSMTLNVAQSGPAVAIGRSEETSEITPKHSALELLRAFGEHGVLPPEVVNDIRRHLGEDVIDAEVVEEEITHRALTVTSEVADDGDPFFEGLIEED